MKIQKKGSKPRIVHVDRLKLVEGKVDTSWFTGEKKPAEDVNQQENGTHEPQPTVREEMGLNL